MSPEQKCNVIKLSHRQVSSLGYQRPPPLSLYLSSADRIQAAALAPGRRLTLYLPPLQSPSLQLRSTCSSDPGRRLASSLSPLPPPFLQLRSMQLRSRPPPGILSVPSPSSFPPAALHEASIQAAAWHSLYLLINTCSSSSAQQSPSCSQPTSSPRAATQQPAVPELQPATQPAAPELQPPNQQPPSCDQPPSSPRAARHPSAATSGCFASRAS